MSVFRSSGNLAADRRYLWAEASLQEGDVAAAADLFRQAVELVPGWAPGWFAYGDALVQAGAVTQAREAFITCLRLDADDVLGASLRLARISDTMAEMPAAYVTGLFDDYAARFDAHLTQELEYRGPEILVQALDHVAAGRSFATALDLGCGTGLMAAELGSRAGVIDGVDLSPLMLRQAEARGLYRNLAVGDVVTFLEQTYPGSYDLVLAADVLVYLGDLGPLFAATRRALSDGGLFAFTCQSPSISACPSTVDAGFILGADMRFAHSAAYLERQATAAGLTIMRLEDVSTRKDAGVAVPGLVAVLSG